MNFAVVRLTIDMASQGLATAVWSIIHAMKFRLAAFTRVLTIAVFCAVQPSQATFERTLHY